MKLAPVVEENSEGSKEFFIPWSAEKANELESDIFVTWVAGRRHRRRHQDRPAAGPDPGRQERRARCRRGQHPDAVHLRLLAAEPALGAGHVPAAAGHAPRTKPPAQ